ncbi:hypothetical protein PHMEG_00026768 [Phytophthora megakarya]|uniref:Uncharacterized protein n=1 Tax=Phytophthora megakarya TaxID=4795 RepID=A0A225V8T6_9STRA|nr:hypothetical protein PHMEG_00026768 [Phytophthora megakarya]
MLAMERTAGAGHLDIIKWLSDHRSEGLVAYTPEGGRKGALPLQWTQQLEMVPSISSNGFMNTRSEGCTTAARDRAAGNGHLEVVVAFVSVVFVVTASAALRDMLRHLDT